jgi:AhpD family alkylhydroperoxidase
MADFPLHSRATAPAGAQPALEVARRTFGFVPNLIAMLGEAPSAAAGYLALAFQFEASSFTVAERQVVLLAASVENGCDYCTGAHVALAAEAGLSEEALASLRAGGPLDDPRLEALARFTRELVRARGRLDEGAVERFLATGFTRAQALEAILGVALKTLSNYANHIASTPLDAAFTRARAARLVEPAPN